VSPPGPEAITDARRSANPEVRLTRELWLRLVARLDLLSFFRVLDQPDGCLPIVTP
jgi:hypothetical protein